MQGGSVSPDTHASKKNEATCNYADKHVPALVGISGRGGLKRLRKTGSCSNLESLLEEGESEREECGGLEGGAYRCFYIFNIDFFICVCVCLYLYNISI